MTTIDDNFKLAIGKRLKKLREKRKNNEREAG